MKMIAVETAEDMRLKDLLDLVANGEVVVLTEGGEGRYVVGTTDELDREAWSLSHNEEFMAYLDACRARGNREGRTSLAEARKQLL